MAVFLALTGALLTASTVSASSPFDVAVGLASRVVPGRLTPIRLTFVDRPSGASRVRITQDVGNVWRGETTMSFEIPVCESDRNGFEVAIPIYDAARPLRVELLSPDGRRLAEREVELRSRRVDDAFQVAVGAFPVPLPGQAASASVAELPTTWSAYDGAESVWIGRVRDELDADQWDALARWVLCGGSLVVFAGSGLFLLDASRLRDLLPILNPTLAERGDGVPVLTGDLRSGASVLAGREGVPWLVGRRYGAGNVLLVTTDALALDVAELTEIRSHAPSAGRLSLVGVASDFLDLQPIAPPRRWVAALLTLLAAVTLPAVVARLGERRSTAPALCTAFAILALLSWMSTDAAHVGTDLYRTNTHVLIEGDLGVSLSASALCSASRQPVMVSVGVDALPYEPLPPSFEPGSHDVAYRDGAARIAFAPRERRILVTQSDVQTRFQVRMAGDEELRLTNRGSRAIKDALLLVDGEVVPLPPLEPGECTVYLSSPSSDATCSLGPEGGSLDRLFVLVRDSLALDRGTWLVAGETTEMVRTEGGASSHARDVTLYVVEVGRD
ncbi:MAG: hypothetical protein PHU43_04965 [Candidatus Bipolaricaulis sp.]|nr:hypothetical protein [Candidatus Bipolaricaulis sp.]